MKVFIACDHAAFKEKNLIIEELKKDFHEVVDLGTDSSSSVNFPDYAIKLSAEVLSDPESRGILLCGTGIGMSIVANKFKGIRAALCRDTIEARLSREHNDANVLCLGARTTSELMLIDIVHIWLETDAESGRHDQRRAIIAKLGQTLEIKKN